MVLQKRGAAWTRNLFPVKAVSGWANGQIYFLLSFDTLLINTAENNYVEAFFLCGKKAIPYSTIQNEKKIAEQRPGGRGGGSKNLGGGGPKNQIQNNKIKSGKNITCKKNPRIIDIWVSFTRTKLNLTLLNV